MSVSQQWNQASLTLVEWATTTSTSKQASKRTGLAASFLIAEPRCSGQHCLIRPSMTYGGRMGWHCYLTLDTHISVYN